MPPSSTGIYSNFTPVRASIPGIASWLRKALGLPTSNMNCGDVWVKAASRAFSVAAAFWRSATGASTAFMTTIILWNREGRSDQPSYRALAPYQHVVAHLQNEHGGKGDRIGCPDAFDADGAAENDRGRHPD